MKRNWLRALLFLPFLGLFACGGGGGGGGGQPPAPPPNTAPTANFAFSCVELVCAFTNTSWDNDVGSSITAYNWTFGDGSPAVSDVDPQYTYGAGATYNVTLTVTDNAGATGTVAKNVTVTAPQAGSDVSAKFVVTCVSLDCTFVDDSFTTGTIQTWAWDFGDGGTSTVQSPVHSYNVNTLTTFTVKLTVTSSSAPGFTSVSTQSLQVAPPASTLNCVGGGGCVLSLAQASTVTVTLVSRLCAAVGNQFAITAPVMETLFTDGCYAPPVGSSFNLDGGRTFLAGTQLEAEVRSGVGVFGGDFFLAFDPALRVSGDFGSGWTLEFDDGAGGRGEPDFDDLVILIKATPI